MSPRVSVVIPAYRSAGTIGATLDGLAGQTFRDFETIVVNSSGDEETARIVAERAPAASFVQAPGRLLPHAARNAGVERAAGELLVFTDPDCVARADWLARLVAAHDAGHRAVAGTNGLAGRSALERAVHLCKYGSWLPGTPAGPVAIAPTANALVARSLWNEIGPFEGDRFSGDAVLSARARERGEPAWLEPRAEVVHAHDNRLAAFLRERYLRGADFAQVRLELDGWGRGGTALRLAALPLVPALLVLRAARAARRTGFPAGGAALLLVLAFQAAWALGEARTYLRRLTAVG